MTRLPTQRASQIGELLPHRWQAIAVQLSGIAAVSGQYGMAGRIQYMDLMALIFNLVKKGRKEDLMTIENDLENQLESANLKTTRTSAGSTMCLIALLTIVKARRCRTRV